MVRFLRTAALLAATLSFFPAARAQSFSTETSDYRPRRLELVNTGDVDAVDPRNGNLVVRHRDLLLPGNGGLDIEVWRTYDLTQVSAGLSSTHNQSFRWTALGPGWTLGVAPRIVHDNNYDVSAFGIYYTSSPFIQLCSGQTLYNSAPYMPTLELPNGDRHELYSVGSYRATTKSNWKVDCVANVVTATSPDGAVWSFGNVSERRIGKFAINDLLTSPELPPLPSRSSTYMVAKTATDVNGNTLTFTYQMFGAAIAPWPMPGDYSGPSYSSMSATSNESPSLLLSGVSASDGRSVSFTYDATSGRLTSMSDNTGRSWSYGYLSPDTYNSRALATVRLPTGISWSYAYAPGDFKTSSDESTIWPLDATTATSRKLTRITYPSGGTVSFEYDFYNLSQPFTSGSGWITMYARGERVKRRTLSTGQSWSYAYTRGGAGQYDTTTMTGPEGTTTWRHMGPGYAIWTQAGYPPALYQNNAWRVGQLMEKTDPTGSVESYVWQAREIYNTYTRILELGIVHDQRVWAADLQQRTVTRNGVSYVTTYSNFDAYGNPGTKVESGPNGGSRTTTLTYLNDAAKWIIGRPKNESWTGASTTRSFDARGRLLSLNRDGVVTSWTYDAQGNVATKTLPRGLVHSYGNYKRGTPQSELQPEGVSIVRVVNDAGNVVSETDGEGRTTSYTYDGLNRLTSTTYPRGNAKRIAYTATTKTATRGSLVETTQLDGFGRAASITLGGITTSYAYDGYGRTTYKSNPGAGVGTSWQYDALGRTVRVTNADGSYRTHAYSGSNVAVTDERGLTTTSVHRSYGDPAQQFLMQVRLPVAAANLTITRNARDLVTSVTQGGVTRSYGYDSRYYLTSIVNPETGTTIYGRDAAGNMTSSSVGGGAATTYGYDGRNRLVGVTYPNGTPSVAEAWTRADKLRSVSSASAVRSYGYDQNDNLVSESLVVDGTTLAASYGYNANDQLASLVYPVTGRTVNYVPDVLGRPTQVSGTVSGVSYWPSGLIAQIQYANGTVSSYSQNSRLWPSGFSTRMPGGGYVASQAYGYDGAGHLRTLTDSVDGSYNRTLDYDGIGRLASAAGPWGSGSVGYDGAGNLRSQTLGSYALTYSYDASNRLGAVSGSVSRSYGYDARGNVTSHSGRSFAYDAAPNLVCADCGSSSRVDYRYDGLNSRVAVTRGGVTRYEFRDARGQLLVEYTPSQGRVVEFLQLGGKRVADIGAAAAGSVAYYHNDISGSPLLATGASAQLLWKESYLPYGKKRVAAAASSSNRIGFHGKSLDDTSGLSYQGARYYDPVVGRFTGIDPVGFDPDNVHSLNGYAYANNNPYRYVDPDGRSPIDVAFLIYDVGKLGVAIYTGVGIGAAAADVAASVVGVASPLPFAGQALKAVRAADKAVDVARVAEHATHAAKGVAGETKFTSAGRRAHAQEPLPTGFEREVTIPGTKLRMDGYNRDTKQILELKPDNARAVQRGKSQLEKYCAACDKSELGPGHTTVPVQTYDPSKYIR